MDLRKIVKTKWHHNGVIDVFDPDNFVVVSLSERNIKFVFMSYWDFIELMPAQFLIQNKLPREWDMFDKPYKTSKHYFAA